jgi:uncharacterized membrane protein
MSSGTDYTQLVKLTWDAITKKDALIVTLVGAAVLSFVGTMTLGILAGPLFLGYAAACMKISRGQSVAIEDLWSGMQRLVPAMLTSLMIGAATIVGLFFCIAPGLIVMFLCTFVFHVMVDQPELSGIDAIKKSAAMVKENITDVGVVWLVGILLNGILSFTLVGVIAGIAFAALMSAFLYHEIRVRSGDFANRTSL